MSKYDSISSLLGAESRRIINQGGIEVMKYRDITIKDEDVKVMEAIFKKKHNDVTDANAQSDSQTLSDLQEGLFDEYPTDMATISVDTERPVLFGELMTQTAKLSGRVSAYYFKPTNKSFERKGYDMVSPETRGIFLRQYKAAETDDERELLLMNNSSRQGIDEFQNWRTQLIADLDLLPAGVEFKRGGGAGAKAVTVSPNSQLFTFPLMVAYLRKKYTADALRKMMMFFNLTGPARKRLAYYRPEEFEWRVTNSNPLLIPLCGLTTAKIAGAVNLAVGGPCFTLAGLAFPAPNQESEVLAVMAVLIDLCKSDISDENAGFYQTIASTVYRFLEPRGYHMNESRLRGTQYQINQPAEWYYNINDRTLIKSNGEPLKKKKTEAQTTKMTSMLMSAPKPVATAASTTSNA